MSTTFAIRGQSIDYEDPTTYLNVLARNARDLLSYLGLTVDVGEPYGEIRAGELRGLIELARQQEPDRGRLGYTELSPHGVKLIVGGRPPERMGEYLDRLEALCERAGDIGVIHWG